MAARVHFTSPSISSGVKKYTLGGKTSRLLYKLAGGGAVSPFIDAAAAYSLRDLGLGATNVVRVRRSSDNTEQDFTAAQITGGGLLAFCGSGDGFVSTWYDQSGNARNATQGTALDQPKIVDSGAVVSENGKAAIKFLNNKLATSIFTLSAQPITRIFVGKSNIPTADFIDGSSTNRGFTGIFGLGNRLFAGNIFGAGTALLTQQLFYGLFNGSSSEIVVNAVSQGTGNSGGNGLDQVILGSHPSVRSADLNGTMQEAIIFASDKTAKIQTLEDNINGFYNIY